MNPVIRFWLKSGKVRELCLKKLGANPVLIITIMRVRSRMCIRIKCIRMKIFLLFTKIYSKINMNVVKTSSPLAIICQRTLEKIQIPLGKSLGNCWVLRQILKAVIVWASYQISKKRGAWQDLNLKRGFAAKEGVIFSGSGGGVGCSFYIKSKLKSEIFNDKKSS